MYFHIYTHERAFVLSNTINSILNKKINDYLINANSIDRTNAHWCTLKSIQKIENNVETQYKRTELQDIYILLFLKLLINRINILKCFILCLYN